MKIRIDEHGRLWIDSHLKSCPLTLTDINVGFTPCGDWCALFATEIMPEYEYLVGHGEMTNTFPAVPKVYLCKKTYTCNIEDFTDERPKP